MAKLMKASDLSSGERLFLLRRRSGLTQARAAHLLGVGVDKYVEYESDQRQPESAVVDGKVVKIKRGNVPVGTVEDSEVCVILRRRSGMLQKELADLMGVSRIWINFMENGARPCHTLIEFWRQKVAA